jgi:hypothetical protein
MEFNTKHMLLRILLFKDHQSIMKEESEKE